MKDNPIVQETNAGLKRLQDLELEMMLKIDEICKRHDLTYYLMGGTLIGAVRHQGFIPWDDDIDLGMPRPDYEKFLQVAPKELGEEFGILTPYDTEGYPFTFAKVINKKMKILYKNNEKLKKWNIWVDIFPLDSMPKNTLSFNIRKYLLLYRRCMVMLSALEDVINMDKENRPFYEKMMIGLGKKFHLSSVLDTKKQILKFDKSLKKYPFEKGPYMVNAMGLYKFKTVFLREVYGEPTYLSFEGHMLRVPEQYDYFLRRLYGDYMQVPPEDKRDHHKIEFISE